MEERILEEIWQDKKVQQIPVVYVCDVIHAVLIIINAKEEEDE